jgi:polar amino acid transport system substrate-binding protein
MTRAARGLAPLAAGLAIGLCACTPSALASPASSSAASPIPSLSATPVFISPPSSLTSAGTITFLSDLTYPPQDSLVNGQPAGFDIDLAHFLAGRMHLTATIQPADYATIVDALLSGRGDAVISAMPITPDLQRQVTFVPYFLTGESILVRKGNPDSIQVLSDLCGKKVAVEVTSPEEDTLTAANLNTCKASPVIIRIYPADTQAVQDLEQGAVDALLEDTPVAAYFEGNHPAQLDLAGAPMQVHPEGIALAPQNTELIRALQQALLSLYQDGTYHRLLEKWNLLADEIPALDIVNPSANPSAVGG